jgi:stringent starvation protein B
MSKVITTDARPHLIPGIYSWMAENFNKVYLTVITDHPKFMCRADLPLRDMAVAISGEDKACVFNTVTLNFGMNAINEFGIDATGISATMRFSQRAVEVYVPFDAIIAVYPPESPVIEPFTFGLMPGQEKYSKEALKNGPQEVVEHVDSVDMVAVAARAAVAESRSQNRTNHLRVVK